MPDNGVTNWPATDNLNLPADMDTRAPTSAGDGNYTFKQWLERVTGLLRAIVTDSRWTDSRAPSGAAGGDLTGTYPNPTIGANKVTSAKVDSTVEITAHKGAASGYMGLDGSGNLALAEAQNLISGTTTGTKIGTGASQKLGFFGATPIVQPAAASDIKTALVNLGLLASGTSPLNLGTGDLTAGTGTFGTTAGGTQLTLGATTTNFVALSVSNTGGSVYLGQEKSTGNFLLTGSAAYATILIPAGSRHFQIGLPGGSGVALDMDTSGNFGHVGRVYPGTPALALQTACGLTAGTGAPSNANGSDGDVYFRSDGGTGTTIYQRRSGSWVGIV